MAQGSAVWQAESLITVLRLDSTSSMGRPLTGSSALTGAEELLGSSEGRWGGVQVGVRGQQPESSPMGQSQGAQAWAWNSALSFILGAGPGAGPGAG